MGELEHREMYLPKDGLRPFSTKVVGSDCTEPNKEYFR